MEKNLPSFVAINTIYCSDTYQARFEELFSTRAGAIDRLPGFIDMEVLKPKHPGEPYLIVSRWKSEEAFRAWVGSPEFLEGHKRGFQDLADAKRAGQPAPMKSTFSTYDVLAR